MFAVHLDTLLFLLLIGMAALLRLLVSKAGMEKKKPRAPDDDWTRTFTPRPQQPVQRPAPQTDEERIRKFLEALGQPTTSKPPPPVIPRTDIPPRPVAPVRPPPGMFPIPGTILTPEQQRRRRVILHEEVAGTPQEPPRKITVVRDEIAPPPLSRRIFTPTTPEAPAVQFREPEIPPQLAQTEKPSPLTLTSLKIEPTGVAVNIIALLQSPEGLRNVVILREILGPPRSLQQLELIAL
jgi:hypothetical protein